MPLKKAILIFVSLLILSSSFFLPLPPSLSPEGKNSLVIFVFCVFLWITQPVPLPVTALLGLSLLALFRVIPALEVFSLFGTQAVFFVLGVFILSASLMKTGLSERAAILILSLFSRTFNGLSFAVLFISTFFPYFIISHGVAAILFPIIISICRVLDIRHEASNMAKRLFLSMAWGTIIGSSGTLIGGARHMLGLEIATKFSSLHGQDPPEITFLGWLAAAFPLVVVLMMAAYFLLKWRFPPEMNDLTSIREYLTEKRRGQGRLSRHEAGSLLVLIATILSIILFGRSAGMGTISVIGGVFTMVLGVIEWDDIERYVNWGILFMYGGAIALGTALDESGAASFIMNSFMAGPLPSHLLFVVILCLVSSLLTEGISNTATVSTLVPLVLPLGVKLGFPILPLTMIVSISSGLAYTLPTGTPAMTLIYSSGYIRVSSVAFPALLIHALSILAVTLLFFIYWPHIGLWNP